MCPILSGYEVFTLYLSILSLEVLVVFSDFEKMQSARSVLIEKLDKSVCVGDPYYSHSAESLNLLR